MIKELVLSTLKEVNEDESVKCFQTTEMLKLDDQTYKFAVQCIIYKKNGLTTTLKSTYEFNDIEKLESASEGVYSDILVQLMKCTLEVY